MTDNQPSSSLIAKHPGFHKEAQHENYVMFSRNVR